MCQMEVSCCERHWQLLQAASGPGWGLDNPALSHYLQIIPEQLIQAAEIWCNCCIIYLFNWFIPFSHAKAHVQDRLQSFYPFVLITTMWGSEWLAQVHTRSFMAEGRLNLELPGFNPNLLLLLKLFLLANSTKEIQVCNTEWWEYVLQSPLLCN